MCKLETPKSRYFIMRDYVKELQSVLDITAPSAISDKDLQDIILRWLAREDVPIKNIEKVEFKCGDPIFKLNGFEITAYQKADMVVRFKLYRHSVKYNLEEEEELPF